MNKAKDEQFNAEKFLDDLDLSSPLYRSIMFFVRNKLEKEVEKLLSEEGVSETDAKKINQYLYRTYCSEIEIIPIEAKDIDKQDVYKFDMSDTSNVALYMVRYGDILQKTHLYEGHSEKEEPFFYLGDQPAIPVEKADQIWKIVRKITD